MRYYSIKCIVDDKNHTFIHSTLFLSTHYMLELLVYLHWEAHAVRAQSLSIPQGVTDLQVTEKGTSNNKSGDVTLLVSGSARIRKERCAPGA